MCIKCLNTMKKWRDKRRDERLSETSSEDSHIEITGVSHSLQEKKCTRCKRILSINNFSRKLDGKNYAKCISCCSRVRKYNNTTRICAHNTRKDYCKQCNDPIQITITNMIKTSKQTDKLYNRYDPINFIDRCFLENLIEDCEDKCHYCQTSLQYTEYSSDMATIERLDNKIGHVKSNCTIACLACNRKHKD